MWRLIQFDRRVFPLVVGLMFLIIPYDVAHTQNDIQIGVAVEG